MSQASASFSPGSIYAHHAVTSRNSSPESIRARRARRSLRLRESADRPTARVERRAPLARILRAFREGHVHDGDFCPLSAHLQDVQREVEALEAWVVARSPAKQRAGATVRRALELLRHFSMLTTMDFSVIPDEIRPRLVHLLALEHRWCYAAAGTTRDAFKIETGRTGAR